MSPEVTREFATSALFFHVSNWNTEPSMSPPETSRTKSDRNCSPFWYIRLTIRSSFGFICLLPHSVSVFPVSCGTPDCKSRRPGQPIPQWRCRWAPPAHSPAAPVSPIPASSSFLQRGVLLLCELQKQPTPARLNPLIHHQPGFLVCESPAAFYQFDHLVGGCEVQSLG